jgi:hypothetical protein
VIHSYEITVRAMDINATVVGLGKRVNDFPPD